MPSILIEVWNDVQPFVHFILVLCVIIGGLRVVSWLAGD